MKLYPIRIIPDMNTPSTTIEEDTELTTLVDAARYGDREAFDRLVERFEPTVFAIALRRLRNRADAQELCQEVFMQALRKIEHLRC